MTFFLACAIMRLPFFKNSTPRARLLEKITRKAVESENSLNLRPFTPPPFNAMTSEDKNAVEELSLLPFGF
ncbi:hypothetical protein D3C73_1042320 [compost metagenome]